MALRTNGPSDYWPFGPMALRNIGTSPNPSIGLTAESATEYFQFSHIMHDIENIRHPPVYFAMFSFPTDNFCVHFDFV